MGVGDEAAGSIPFGEASVAGQALASLATHPYPSLEREGLNFHTASIVSIVRLPLVNTQTSAAIAIALRQIVSASCS